MVCDLGLTAFTMQKMRTIVNSQTPSWTEGNITVISAEAVVNSGYANFSLQTGQFSLQQPWQRSSAGHSEQQKQPLAGAKRLSDDVPKHYLHPAEHQQQVHRDIETILQAHRQLLQLCHQVNNGAIEAAADRQGSAQVNTGAVSESKASTDDAATRETLAVPCATIDIGAHWPAVAAMKHVLKPKISFQHTDLQGKLHTVHSKLFDVVIRNSSSSEAVATAYDRQVLLPQGSTFCMSDITRLQPFVHAVQEQGGADVLLVDPPWENASARRSAAYGTLTPNHLLYLPIKDIVRQAQSSLVALWVTNRPRMHRFIQQQLLPAWGMQHVATWFWLKVTDAGEPVTPLGGLHRHPFEQLWLLRPALQQQQQQQPGTEGASHTVPMQAVAPGGADPAVSMSSREASRCSVSGAAATVKAQEAASERLSWHLHDGIEAVPADASMYMDPGVEGASGAQPILHHHTCAVATAAPPETATIDQGTCSTVLASAVFAAAPKQLHRLCEAVVNTAAVLQPPDRHVIVAVPGAHSRKPHLRHLLLRYAQHGVSKVTVGVSKYCDINSSVSAPVCTLTDMKATGQPDGKHDLLRDTTVAQPDRFADDGVHVTVMSSSSTSMLMQSNRAARNYQRPLFVELFARELFPGCMSWGNEVLKFQDMQYWHSTG